MQACRAAAVPTPAPAIWRRRLSGAGASAPSLLFSSLDQTILISGVEWDSLWGAIGCHLWHLLPVQKNKSKCSALGFLNSCPNAETRLSAKLWEGGEQGLRRGRWGWEWGGTQGGGGAGGGGGQGHPFGRRRSSLGWDAGKVGDSRASRVPRVGVGARGVGRGRGYRRVGNTGRSATLGGLGGGCLDGGCAWGGGPAGGYFGAPARWATLGAPRLWAGWGEGKGEARGGGAGGSSLTAARERAPSQPSHAVRERRVAASAQTVPWRCGFQRAPPPSNHGAAQREGYTSAGQGCAAHRGIAFQSHIHAMPCAGGSPRSKQPRSSRGGHRPDYTTATCRLLMQSCGDRGCRRDTYTKNWRGRDAVGLRRLNGTNFRGLHNHGDASQ